MVEASAVFVFLFDGPFDGAQVIVPDGCDVYTVDEPFRVGAIDPARGSEVFSGSLRIGDYRRDRRDIFRWAGWRS